MRGPAATLGDLRHDRAGRTVQRRPARAFYYVP
jgi:hypothetical protein